MPVVDINGNSSSLSFISIPWKLGLSRNPGEIKKNKVNEIREICVRKENLHTKEKAICKNADLIEFMKFKNFLNLYDLYYNLYLRIKGGGK